METEYRVVLFTDQVDSTSRTRMRTPEELRRVADDQAALTAKAAGQTRGRILKDTGDGHLLLFDAPDRAAECGVLV